jgi:undecaprenyl-diphosphatase
MDEALLAFINQTLAHPWLDTAMPIVGWVGLALCPAIAVVLVAAGQRRGSGQLARLGLALLAALLIGLALTLATQYLSLRARPEGARVLAPAPNFPSFPSGHAMAVFAAATVLGLGFGRRAGRPALAVAGLVCLSRIYQGHHYPTDVLAGAVLGAGVGAAAFGLAVRGRAGQGAWHWLLWPQLALVVVVSLAAYVGALPLWLLDVPGLDKVLHFSMFGLVAFWLHGWLARVPGLSQRLAALAAVGLPFSLAALEETAQGFSRLRTFDTTDLAADLAGMVVCVALSVLVTGGRRPALSLSQRERN